MNISDPRFVAIQKPANSPLPHSELAKNVVSNRLKTFFKRWPAFYLFLRETFGPTHSPLNGFRLRQRVRELFAKIGEDAVVLNLGSGATRVHPNIINADIFPLSGVDLVADIGDMPLQDGVVDGIVCDSVLEHIEDIPRALDETARILKSGGKFYVTGLFLYPYHSSPNDFYRWTEQGIRSELERRGFRILELGIRGGPMGTLQGILMHIFALPFSLISQALYFPAVQFFMVVFSPLKLLDIVWMRFPASLEIASDMYIIAEKD